MYLEKNKIIIQNLLIANLPKRVRKEYLRLRVVPPNENKIDFYIIY